MKLPFSLPIIWHRQHQTNINFLGYVQSLNLILSQVRLAAFAFLQSMSFTELFGCHSDNETIEHVSLVGVMEGLWVFMQKFDLCSQQWELLAGFDVVKAFDVNLLKPHCLAHNQHGKAILSHGIAQLFLALIVFVGGLLNKDIPDKRQRLKPKA